MYPSTGDITTKGQLQDWILAGGLKCYIHTDPALRRLVDLIAEKVNVRALFCLHTLHTLYIDFRVIKGYVV